MSAYIITYERDRNGWWVASAQEVPGCRTQGRTISQARKRIREALGLFVDDADSAELIDDVKLPHEIRVQVEEYLAARRQAERELAEAQRLTREAAWALTESLHLGLRDASEILGLSHQRIQQILKREAV